MQNIKKKTENLGCATGKCTNINIKYDLQLCTKRDIYDFTNFYIFHLLQY